MQEQVVPVIWHADPGFWINAILGVGGLVLSWLAYKAAKKAQTAALAAGTVVKIQTVTLELNEISQKLDKLDSDISFAAARDLINESSRRIRRLIAPIQGYSECKELCVQLKEALDVTKEALKSVAPSVRGSVEVVGEGNGEGEVPNSVYFAIQGQLANVNSLVAEITGLLEAKSIRVDPT